MTYQCPVCWRPVRTNNGGVNLANHEDKTGKPCPGSGFPHHRIEKL